MNEYGGSFAVMTRAGRFPRQRPRLGYSFCSAAFAKTFGPPLGGNSIAEMQKTLGEQPIAARTPQGLEINPKAREYFFKVVDDGDHVTLTIQDTHDAAIKKTVSVRARVRQSKTALSASKVAGAARCGWITCEFTNLLLRMHLATGSRDFALNDWRYREFIDCVRRSVSGGILLPSQHKILVYAFTLPCPLLCA